MADPGEMGNDAPLTAQFTIKKTEVTVTLSEDCIHWEAAGKTKPREVTVRHDDVITARALAGAHGFELHYIVKEENFKWRHECTMFRTSDEDRASVWLAHIKEHHAKAVAARDWKTPRRLLAYVNPKSGASKGVQIWRKQAEPLFKLAGVELETIIAEGRHHITNHVFEYDMEGTQTDGVVVVGGDGTFTEAAIGLINRKIKETGNNADDPNTTLDAVTIPLGIIPGGTGQGNVTRTTGTKDVTTAVLNVIYGHHFPMDTFTVHDDERLVVVGNLLCSFGLGSHSMEISEANRKRLGRARYLWGFFKALKELWTFRGDVEMKLSSRHEDGSTSTNDEHPETKSLTGTFLDVSAYPFDMSRQKTVESGELCVVIGRSNVNRKTIVKHVGRLARQKPDTFDFDYIETYIARMITIKPSKDQSSHPEEAHVEGNLKLPTLINVDGEIFPVNGSAIRIRVQPNIMTAYGQPHEIASFVPEKRKTGEASKASNN